MAFPNQPTNGQQANVNGVIYIYSTTLTAWTVLTNTGANVSANNVAATNNIAAITVSATGNIVTQGFVLGNGSQLTGVSTTSANINNGTSNVTVVSSGGNITASVGGTSNVAVFATTGEYVTGVVSVSSNITGGNLLTAGVISATGNATGGNVVTVGIMSSTGNAIHGNILTAGLISATGNATAGNVVTAGLITAAGNVQAGNIRTAGLVSSTGNILTAGNITVSTGKLWVGSAVGTIGPASQIESVAAFGNAALTNFLASAPGSAQGQLAGYSFRSTLSAAPGDNGPRRSADIWSGFNGGNWGTEYLAIGVGNNGAANDSANITSEKLRITSTGNVSVTGNISATGNITGNYVLGNGSQLTGISSGNSSINITVTSITANYTIAAGQNGLSVGPMNTGNNVQVSIANGQRWIIL
jgi:hypothetical protein